jgi:GMP synthase (glutamine-hydrolysing)
MRPICIIKVGSASPVLGPNKPDFEHWIVRGMGVALDLVRVCSPHLGDTFPKLEDIAGVIVTGSAAMVTDKADWSEQTAAWMADVVAAQVPLLGICYGHQLLAHALGGVVDYNPKGREIGTVAIDVHEAGQADDLLGSLPTHFWAQASHSQSVIQLPKEARLLASNDLEPHHAFVVGDCAWGVQFHPEFDAHFIRALIDHREKDLKAEGLDVDALRLGIRETPEAYGVLKRFAELVAQF